MPFKYIEFEDWLLANNYVSMFEAWVDEDYDRWEAPSVDRDDNSKGYTFDNMTLMTWGQNCEKSHKEAEKAVGQYDLEGSLLATYVSSVEACSITNINQVSITSRCRGEGKTAGGFIWRYL